MSVDSVRGVGDRVYLHDPGESVEGFILKFVCVLIVLIFARWVFDEDSSAG